MNTSDFDLPATIFFFVQHSLTLSLNIFNRVLYLVTLMVNLQCSDHVYDDCLQLNPVTTLRLIALKYILFVTITVFNI